MMLSKATRTSGGNRAWKTLLLFCFLLWINIAIPHCQATTFDIITWNDTSTDTNASNTDTNTDGWVPTEAIVPIATTINSTVNGTDDDEMVIRDDDLSTDDNVTNDDEYDDDDGSYYDDDMLGTPADAAAYIVTKISSSLSLLGSSAIIWEVWGERKHVADHPSNRVRRSSPSIGLMLTSASISDIFFSAAYFVGNWASPTDTEYMWMPRGNTQSCTAQGFFLQLGWAATPVFSLALSIYFLLIVRYNWTQQQLQMLDPWVHGGAWILAFTMALLPIFWDLYNDSWGVCWVEPKPYYCSPNDDDWPCTRGHNAANWALVYTIFPAWVCLFASTIVMFLLYLTVRGMETERMGNTLPASDNGGDAVKLNTVSRQRSRKVATQGILFLSAYYLVFVPDFISFLLSYINEEWWNFWYDFVVYSILLPLLGFFNFMVFAWRRDRMYTRYGLLLSRVICCFGLFAGATLHLRETLVGKSTKLWSSLAQYPSRATSGAPHHSHISRASNNVEDLPQHGLRHHHPNSNVATMDQQSSQKSVTFRYDDDGGKVEEEKCEEHP